MVKEKKFVKEIQYYNNKLQWNFFMECLFIRPSTKKGPATKKRLNYNIFLYRTQTLFIFLSLKIKLEIDIDFYNSFDKVYYSHEAKFRKPNKESFQIILKEKIKS